eukprot:EC815323.1.p2 GENE.EC815323.1~~EC815323.1.p2  ORF type:complete len:121 (+),score=22.08 EC815323.1:226-588(+)
MGGTSTSTLPPSMPTAATAATAATPSSILAATSHRWNRLPMLAWVLMLGVVRMLVATEVFAVRIVSPSSPFVTPTHRAGAGHTRPRRGSDHAPVTPSPIHHAHHNHHALHGTPLMSHRHV